MLLIDDFEDGDLSEYTVADGSGSDPSLATDVTYEGSYALQYEGNDWSNIISSSGLDHYPARGDTIRWRIYANSNMAARIQYGLQSATNRDDCYNCKFNVRDGNFRIEARSGGSSTTIAANDSISLPADEWCRVEVQWVENANGNTDLTATAWDSAGTELDTISGTDTDYNYTSGNFGWGLWGHGTSSRALVDYAQIDRGTTATATSQVASASGPGATTTTSRTAPTTTESLAGGGGGATTTTTRTTSATGQALAETSPGASTTTTPSATATGSALAAFGKGAQGGLTDLTRAVVTGQALAATGNGATTSPTATATAANQPLAAFGDGAVGTSGAIDIAIATGQSLGVTGSTVLGYGEGGFGEGGFGESISPVTTSRAAPATGGTLSAAGTGARGGITHAIVGSQRLAPSPDGASATATRTATASGQTLATSPTSASATTTRTATTPGQSLAVWAPGARAAGFTKSHTTVADTITATTASETELVTATTASETEWIGATVDFDADAITATTAAESEPIAATVAFETEKLISELHRSSNRE